MIAWFTSQSFWLQSTIAGLAFIPITVVATLVTRYLLDEIIGRSFSDNRRICLASVVFFVYAILILTPTFTHLLLAEPLIRSEGFDRLRELWLAIWYVISLIPIFVLAKLDHSENGRLRLAVRNGLQAFFVPMGLFSMCLPFGLFGLLAAPSFNEELRHLLVIGPVLFGVVFFSCFLLFDFFKRDDRFWDNRQNRPGERGEITQPPMLFSVTSRIVILTFYAITILVFYI